MKAVLLAIVSTTLVVVAQAQAQASPPGASAVDAYVEAVPTGNGAAVPSAVAPSKPATDAPAIANALKTIAESPRYGAPIATPSQDQRPSGTEPELTTSFSDSFRSTLGAIGTSSDARLLGVLLVVVSTTIAAVVLAIRRGPS